MLVIDMIEIIYSFVTNFRHKYHIATGVCWTFSGRQGGSEISERFNVAAFKMVHVRGGSMWQLLK